MQPRDLSNVRGEYGGMSNAKSTFCSGIGYTKDFCNDTSRTGQQVRITVESRDELNGTPYLAVGVATLMETSVI